MKIGTQTGLFPFPEIDLVACEIPPALMFLFPVELSRYARLDPPPDPPVPELFSCPFPLIP